MLKSRNQEKFGNSDILHRVLRLQVVRCLDW